MENLRNVDKLLKLSSHEAATLICLSLTVWACADP